jgi:hypothetical protein
MKRELTLDYLDHRLEKAVRILGDSAGLIRDLELGKENIRRTGEAIASIFEIQRVIYEQRPDLMPEFLKVKPGEHAGLAHPC